MYSKIRSGLFCLDPERAHALALSLLRYIPRGFFSRPQLNPVTALGLQFPHRIGLAAGFDKSGEYLDALAKLGFSFIEIGTITPKPQSGNPKPRLFRLAAAKALINRMGFNNAGVEQCMQNINRSQYTGILGINIGKGRDTPLTAAVDDYLYCLQRVYSKASYITINISSPNTPELRQLQQVDYFNHLVGQLRESQLRLADQQARYVPLLIKISPDESRQTLQHMADVMLHHQLDGVVISNTSCDRTGVEGLAHAEESGGLSGAPLLTRSTQCLALFKRWVGEALTLVGVGGIDAPEAAQDKYAAGASLLQIYTGLIYQGPGLVRQLSEVIANET